MSNVLIFAGTTEGILLSNLLAQNGIFVKVCVATEYGSFSYEESEHLQVLSGRLTEKEMETLIKQLKPELVLDATHPYAAEVTQNIRAACETAGFQYERVVRERTSGSNETVYVESPEEAVRFLKDTRGNILLTTGSKELAKYTALPEYQERLYARVLSLPEVVEHCSALGLSGKHLIGMQGPFSKELNEAMLRQFNCRYLVTKDTGKAGGFQEKIDAAKACGVIPVVIGRPLQEEGWTLQEAKKNLAKQFGFTVSPKITLLGIGMGSPETLTIEGKQALEQADLLIGAARMVEAAQKCLESVSLETVSKKPEVLQEYRGEQIRSYLEAHPEYEQAVIVLSGDVGFYSGAKKLLECLGPDVRVICGISSVSYFMSKIGCSWEDAKLASVHGRETNLISLIRCHKKVFSIVGSADGIADLAKKLVYYGMGEVLLYVGEELSYEKETIFCRKAEELVDYRGEALAVVCAWNPEAAAMQMTHGIPDEQFQRGQAPMTKSEVRTVSLAKLRLREDSVCYDVGAGTGSVAVEMALRAHQGAVYAIEKKEEAARLIEENKRKFGVDHLTVVRGMAPEALEDLPVPTHAFIGGSSGNLREILRVLLKKKKEIRIVINCITLETVAEAMTALKEFEFEETEVVQLGVSRAKELGSYHLMMGENPIYVITCQKQK